MPMSSSRRRRSGVMVKLLIKIERSAASSHSIVLRLKLFVNLTRRIRRITYQYRVSGLVQLFLWEAHDDGKYPDGR